MPNKNSFSLPVLARVAFAFGLGGVCVWLLFVPQLLKRPFLGPPQSFDGQCTKVVDGDTVVVTTRFDGVFKVNLVSARAPQGASKFSAQAARFTTQTLLSQYVTVTPVRGVAPGEVDAWVYAGPLCFNHEIVRAGYARYAHDALGDAPIRAAQKEARTSARGLWSDSEFRHQRD